MLFAIILVAAGASARMGFSKLWTDVRGQPLLAYAIDAARAATPNDLVVVVSPDRVIDTFALRDGLTIARGGARPRRSVAPGPAMTSAEGVALHDAPPALPPP